MAMELSHMRSSTVSLNQSVIEKKTTDNEAANYNLIAKAPQGSTTHGLKLEQTTSLYEDEHYGNNALWLFANDNLFRLRVQQVVTHKYFTYAINILIIINSIFLIFETIDSLQDVSKYSNIVFTVLFTIEFIMKVIAYGFILEPYSYLRDPWNWLDFLVVITSLLTLIPEINANLMALRTFRLIRPLQSITIFPTLRIFLSTLISSLVDLSIIYLMMFFFLMIFAILGVSLWSERFHYRCRTVTAPVNNTLPIDPLYANVLCGGRIQCSSKEYCLNSLDYYPLLISKDVIDEEHNNPALNWGLTTFGNILESLFVVFLTTTCEGWPEIMGMYMDGYDYVVSLIFFVLCVVINYYFMFNLSVATLLYNFETAKRVDSWVFLKSSKTKDRMDKESTINAIGARNSKDTNGRNIYRLKYIPLKTISSNAKVKGANLCSFVKLNQCFEVIHPRTEYHLKFKFGFFCYYFYNQPFTQYFFYLCIFINSILLTLDRVNMGEAETTILEVFNIVLVGVFVFEVIVLMFSVGLYVFFRSFWSIFDCLIVFVSLVEIIIRKATNSNSASSVISIFRLLRILRVLKLFRTWVNFQVIMSSLRQTLVRMTDYLFVFLLFVYMYTLLGYSFFHGAMTEQDFNFDSFISSLICVIRIIIGDHWQDIFYECHKATEFNNVPTYIYFITLIFFGQITLVNIFLSYLFDNFQRSKKHYERNVIVKNFINDIFTFITKEHNMQASIGRPKEEVAEGVKTLNKYLQKIQQKKVIAEGDFVMKGKLRMDFTFFRTIDNEAFLNSLKENCDTVKAYHMKVIFFDRRYRRDKAIQPESSLYSDDDFYNFHKKYLKPPSLNKKAHLIKSTIVNEFKENLHEDSSEDSEMSVKRRNSAPQLNAFIASRKLKRSKLYSTKISAIKLSNYKEQDGDAKELEAIESIESIRPLKKDDQCELTISSIGESKLYHGDREESDSQLSRPDQCHDEKSSHSVIGEEKRVKKASTHALEIENHLLHTKTFLKRNSIQKKRVMPRQLSIKSESEVDESLMIELASDVERAITTKERLELFKKKLEPIVNHMKNSSLFIFHKDWKIRQVTRKLVYHLYFNYTIFGLIICNCVMMCFDNPWLDPNSNAKKAIFCLNRVFNIFFIIEGFLKVVSDCFIFKEKEDLSSFSTLKKALNSDKSKDSISDSDAVSLNSAMNTSAVSWNKMNSIAKEQMMSRAKQIENKRKAYLFDMVNVLDFICIILSIVDMSIVKNLAYLRVLRVFRAIKPIRLLTKSENLNIMINCLIKSIPALANVLLLCALFIFIFGLLGVSLFKNLLYYYCTDVSLLSQADCLAQLEHWYINPYNFSNFAVSLKTNFLIMMADNWGEMMAYAGHKLGHRWVYWYYIIYVVAGYFIILNLLVSVLIQNFKFLKDKQKQYKTLSPPEKEWIHLQKLVLKRIPHVKPVIETSNKVQSFIHSFLQSKLFDNAVLVLISMAIVVLVMQYNEASKEYRLVLDAFSYVLSVLMNVEVAMKLYIWRKQFFLSYWNVIDLCIMVLCDVLILLNILTHAEVCDLHSLTVLPITLRAFRLLRGLRELHSFRSFHSLIDTLMYLLPTIANVGIILFLVMVIYANIGMNVFGTLPLRTVINENINFRDFLSTSLLLFQIATKDSVGEFLHEMSYHDCTNASSGAYQENFYCFHYNITCYDAEINYTSMNEFNMFSCGSDFSYFYIISFILIGPLFIMNLCIVMVIEGFSESMKDNEGILTTDYMKKFIDVWLKYDPQCTRLIKPYEFALMIKELQPSLGINYDRSDESMSSLSPKDRNKYEAYREVIQRIEQQSELRLRVGGEAAEEEEEQRPELSIVKKERNAYVFEDRFYLSHDLTNYTNEKEIMLLCDKFHFSPIETQQMKDDYSKRSSVIILNEVNVIVKDYFIHYIDACLALTRFAICKMMQVDPVKLRLDVVASYTQKLWLRKFKDEKKIVNSFFKPKSTRERLSSILATKILYKKVLKKEIARARLRLVDRRNEQLIIEEEEQQRRIYEEMGSILNMEELEINIPIDKEPIVIEERERNIDQMFKNDVVGNSKRKRTQAIDTQIYFFKMKQMSYDDFKMQNQLGRINNGTGNKPRDKANHEDDEFYCEKEFTSSQYS